jgi:nucleoside-diphosphate-sugar epimerase
MLSHMNVGTGADVSILAFAKMVPKVTQFTGKITIDPSKLDETMLNLMDVERLNQMGWSARVQLEQGIADIYAWYLANAQSVRT